MPDKEKKYEVFTPVSNFTGRRFGVQFKNGKALANRFEAEILVKNWGYSCPELEKEWEEEKGKGGGEKKGEGKGGGEGTGEGAGEEVSEAKPKPQTGPGQKKQKKK